MRVADINVDKNISILENEVQTNSSLSDTVKTSILEHNEVIKILLERFQRTRTGRKKSGESSDPPTPTKKPGPKPGSGREQLPSERYPDAPVIEKDVDFPAPPSCPCCRKEMTDSGMKEEREELTVIPRKFLIYRFLKRKYRCRHCHGAVVTPKGPPRILPRSAYGDDMILDVALSKYCDLLPVERYAAMAAREGLEGLPPQSLIRLTHALADFLTVVFFKLKAEVEAAKVVHADETPHKMLEGGDGRKNWFLWGFSSRHSCFFDIRKSRSGDVAGDFLKGCLAEYLVSDVYSGYAKAVSIANKEREKRGAPPLKGAYCNAHARRMFKDAEEKFPTEVKVFLNCYARIYALDREGLRREAGPCFEIMKREAGKLEGATSKNLSLGKAARYFLKNYEGLTRCLEDGDVPLDNNLQERLLRNPVVGRKTWYGTHSRRGARTAAMLFSLVNACHLNKVNPREYFPFVTAEIHQGGDPPTPSGYAEKFQDSS